MSTLDDDDKEFVRALVARLRHFHPQLPATFDWETHEAGMETAYDDGLADHVNRLVRFFVDGELVPHEAWASPRPYSIRSGDYVFLQGDCTKNNPGVVVVPSHDIRVRPVLDEPHGVAFSHWEAPTAHDALRPFSSTLAGPSPVVHSPRSGTPRAELFARGTYGKIGAGGMLRHYRLDSRSIALRQAAEHNHLSLVVPGTRLDRHGVQWDFARPVAPPTPLESYAEHPPSGALSLDPRSGALNPQSTPSSLAVWNFFHGQWVARGVARGKEPGFYTVCFSAQYDRACEEAREVLKERRRSEREASLGKEAYLPTARASARRHSLVSSRRLD
ncbi:uncharacterized protein RHOBADRAFT_44294 [Rhodotorula graminis WP1]|uniref:Uncharacterized protein n=1 Tax=Rhodotorula graminis (strain WP1) TaxID=578459 RepID=A0A194S2N9_RHOGW|nr:uncharacterized protein RHOBADRAFT_44294 [Rhodotorula graminis WP1]KPV74775.1 hypothetical protein RHOBADRAFT_44294 [Rhodotorula graminis WP1]